jgi:hypothetical protein
MRSVGGKARGTVIFFCVRVGALGVLLEYGKRTPQPESENISVVACLLRIRTILYANAAYGPDGLVHA